jgi:hypothetical protein
MSEVFLNKSATLKEAEDQIVALGANGTVHLMGEPGVGKTAMFKNIVRRTGFKGIYIDVPNVELGELGIPIPDHTTKTTRIYPNEQWGFHLNEPLVIFCDEITKGHQSVQNMLHPMLNEPRQIMGIPLHKDTIVITAGNFTSDGVGDNMRSHTRNRVSVVTVKKPHAGFNPDGSIDADSWGAWAVDNDVAPEVLAWVKNSPHCLASYLDASQAGNKYIFNPKEAQKSFVSPRSLVRASNILKARAGITTNTTICALEGTIGAPAARDLMSFVEVADSLPSWEEICKSPATAQVPTSPAALCLLAFSAVQRVDRESIGKFFEYLKRTPKELQSVFCLTGMKNDEKKKLFLTSQSFVDWMRTNQYLF